MSIEMDWDAAGVIAEQIAEATNSDVILYNGKVTWPYRLPLASLCDASKFRDNVLLVLVTLGGDPDAAYRIIRYLRGKYSRVTVFTPSFCKSAGTLVVIGADELVMSETAELGPLDVQMSKPDELDELRSSFIINDAFASLQNEATDMLIATMLALKKKTSSNITLKTAVQVSAELTGSLFSGLYAQIDPMHVGEAYRASRIALDYAKRLTADDHGLAHDDALTLLVSGYPSHSFVIDLAEAQSVLGKKVRRATEIEAEMARRLGMFALIPFQSAKVPLIDFLSVTKEGHDEAAKQKQSSESANGKDNEGAGEGGGRSENAGAEVTPIRQGS